MINAAIETLANECDLLKQILSNVLVELPGLERADGSPLELNFDVSVPDAFGSIDDCHERIQILLSLAVSVSKLERTALKPIPKNSISGLIAAVTEIKNQLNAMMQLIANTKTDGGLRDVGDDLVIFSVNQQQHKKADLRPYYKAADNQVDQGILAAQRILSIVNPKNYDAFAGAVVGIKALEKHLQQTRKDMSILRRDAKAKATQISNQAEEASKKLAIVNTEGTAAVDEANNYKEETLASSLAASKSEEEITDLLSNIDVINQQAGSLKAQLEAIKPIMTDFQVQLDSRNEMFVSGKKSFDELQQEMVDAAKKNGEYIAQSKEALGWNTAKGLADSFANSAKELEDPLTKSRWGFYLAVLLLFVSAGLAFNGIPGLRAFIEVPKLPTVGSGFDATLVAGLIAALSIKAAVLLPAAIFVGFTSRRHRALFHQHQLYIYKKTIASALPGFKDHAETHQEAMAAAAFARLLFNPQEDASRDLTKEAGGQWWLSKWLEKVITKSMKAVMAADGKKVDD